MLNLSKPLYISLVFLILNSGFSYALGEKTLPEAQKNLPAISLVKTGNKAVNTALTQKLSAKLETADEKALHQILQNLLEAANTHDIKALLKHYSPHFISGDSLSLKDVKSLIEDTWKAFPDIQYTSKLMEMRVNGKWATIETIDESVATADIDPLISQNPGKMRSRSRAILYLQKVGSHWEVVSDATLYEKAHIVYGPFDDVDIDVQSPEQVFSGEDYTAKLIVNPPKGTVGFASLTKEQLTHPHQKTKDKFRTLSGLPSNLERIFEANTTNTNEMVTATVGFTQIGQDNRDRPTIQFKGVITVVKRVNVISKSTFEPGNNTLELVRHSADGKISFVPKKEKSSSSKQMPGKSASDSAQKNQ
ncbi:MAG: hypothetical protein AAGI66_04365 [Cyanobacteria bacterium P01_H01_bin.74]